MLAKTKRRKRVQSCFRSASRSKGKAAAEYIVLLADIADIPLRRSHFCAWSECAIDVAEKSIRGILGFKRSRALSYVFQMACSFVSWQHSLAGSDIFQMFGVGCGSVGSAFSAWVAVTLFVYDFWGHDIYPFDFRNDLTNYWKCDILYIDDR